MTWLVFDCMALSLATIAVLNVWFKGSIFAGWRAYFEARSGRLGELLGCPLCLSPHVAWAMAWCFIVPAHLTSEPCGVLLRLPVYVWAAILPVQLYFFDHHMD